MHDAVDTFEKEFQKFTATMGDVVSHAARGHFDHRVEETSGQKDLLQIAKLFNTVLQSVDQATAETSKLLQTFASGNLQARMEGQYAGVFETLQKNGNGLGQKLQELVGQINRTSNAIDGELSKLAKDANDLKHRAMAQSGNLDAASDLVDQVTSAVNDNAASANRAADLSQSTTSVAESGANIAQNAVTAMTLASEKTGKISEVTASVESIAFQTNLLALNAAVEAARVGELGKGFAVVATEVRALAVQASQASAQISDMIGEGESSVSNGRHLVTETGDVLGDINTSISEVMLAVSEIAKACDVQSTDMAKVGASIHTMKSSALDNSKMAETGAMTVDRLSEQSTQLKDLVSFFDVAPDNKRHRSAA